MGIPEKPDYLALSDVLDETLLVQPSDEPQLDTAMCEYLNTGRDSLLHLTLLDGDSVRIRTSFISGWVNSTACGRARAVELEAGRIVEHAENRKMAGLWDD